MSIQVPTLLLDGSALAILEKQDMYGYLLTNHCKIQQQRHVPNTLTYDEITC